ncbi:uncharacterized protein LOC142150724 [Mixophyes fleayi]|uniref:uncharacterized protein LOC142150724 n=1 Tax=Mixophyes fleayi TaxID=3061075 RepID=UPI003F4DECEF
MTAAQNVPVTTPAAAATSSSPAVASTAVLRLSPSEKFDGEPKRCRGFLNQCLIHFECNPASFPSERIKVAFIISLLSGQALAWASPLWERNDALLANSSTFIETFRKVFDEPGRVSSAASSLLNLRQGSMTVGQYAIQFRTLSSELSWNNEALVAAFWQGLSDRAKDELTSRELSTDLDLLITLCNRIDLRFRERTQERSASRRVPTRLAPMFQNPILQEEPMQIGRSRLSAEERQRRFKQNLCLYCGDPGCCGMRLRKRKSVFGKILRKLCKGNWYKTSRTIDKTTLGALLWMLQWLYQNQRGDNQQPSRGERGTSSEAFIQYPITPPILARRGDRLTHNPPAPHQLHFPPSPFLPHSGSGSSWGAHYGGAPLSDRGPFRPYTPGTDRVQSFRLGQRHVGSDRPSSGNLEVFGDSPLAPVRPSLSCYVLPATDEWTYRSRRAPSPSGAYGSTSQFRPGPTRDNLVYDYHHSSGSNTSQWSPSRRTQSRPSLFYEESYLAPYDDFPPQRRVISRGSYSPSPLLPSRLEPCGPALGSVRRRLDYVPRSQLTAPLCVSEPAVANQEMRAVGGGRSGSKSRDQRSAGIRVEPIPGSTDAQPGSASVMETSVAAGNPAPHDHQAGIRGLIEQAVAPSTLRTYQASWRQWSLFSGQ